MAEMPTVIQNAVEAPEGAGGVAAVGIRRIIPRKNPIVITKPCETVQLGQSHNRLMDQQLNMLLLH